ncbi:hypothetical protein QDZ86_005447 [Pluralibacter gergoviae]
MTTDIKELTQNHELLIANGQQAADLLRHLANNEIDSDYFAVVSECEAYGNETEEELSITEFALRAAGCVDALIEALEAKGAECHRLSDELRGATALVTLMKIDARELVKEAEAKDARIAELENDEVRQRLVNAEHQLYMAELAKNNLRASRKAQFRKRRNAERRADEMQSRAEAAESRKPDVYLCRVTRNGEELYSPCGADYHRGHGYYRAAGIQTREAE